MPGPLRKKPKTSLNCEQTYSGYSSDPNTKRKLIESPDGMKSNSSTATQRWVFTKKPRSGSAELLGALGE